MVPSHKAKHKLESRFRLAFNEIGKIPNKENKLKEKTLGVNI